MNKQTMKTKVKPRLVKFYDGGEDEMTKKPYEEIKDIFKQFVGADYENFAEFEQYHCLSKQTVNNIVTDFLEEGYLVILKKDLNGNILTFKEMLDELELTYEETIVGTRFLVHYRKGSYNEIYQVTLTTGEVIGTTSRLNYGRDQLRKFAEFLQSSY